MKKLLITFYSAMMEKKELEKLSALEEFLWGNFNYFL